MIYSSGLLFGTIRQRWLKRNPLLSINVQIRGNTNQMLWFLTFGFLFWRYWCGAVRLLRGHFVLSTRESPKTHTDSQTISAMPVLTPPAEWSCESATRHCRRSHIFCTCVAVPSRPAWGNRFNGLAHPLCYANTSKHSAKALSCLDWPRYG